MPQSADSLHAYAKTVSGAKVQKRQAPMLPRVLDI
jgi:hypothetical protein